MASAIKNHRPAPPPEWDPASLDTFTEGVLADYAKNQRRLQPDELGPLLKAWAVFRAKADPLLEHWAQTIQDAGYLCKTDRLPDNGVRITIELSLTRSLWLELTPATEGGRPVLAAKTKGGTRTQPLESVTEKWFIAYLQSFLITVATGRT